MAHMFLIITSAVTPRRANSDMAEFSLFGSLFFMASVPEALFYILLFLRIFSASFLLSCYNFLQIYVALHSQQTRHFIADHQSICQPFWGSLLLVLLIRVPTTPLYVIKHLALQLGEHKLIYNTAGSSSRNML